MNRARSCTEARTGSAAHWIEALCTLPGAPAVVLLNGDGTPEVASPRARELLGAGSGEASAFEAGWSAFDRDLRAAAGRAPAELEHGTLIELELRVPRPTSKFEPAPPRAADPGASARGLRLDAADLRVRVEIVAPDPGGSGRLLLIEDCAVTGQLGGLIRSGLRHELLARVHAVALHDMKAPLNTVVLSLALIEDELRERGATAALDRVRVMAEELQRLDRMLKQVLLAASAPPVQACTFDVRAALARFAAAVRPICALHRVALEIGGANEPLAVTCDPARLHHALSNLLVHALEAAKEGTLALSAKRAGNAVEVSFEHPAPPPEGDMIEPLFDLAATARPGAACGLFVARAAIEETGGAIRVARSSSGGTAIRIQLPAAR